MIECTVENQHEVCTSDECYDKCERMWKYDHKIDV